VDESRETCTISAEDQNCGEVVAGDDATRAADGLVKNEAGFAAFEVGRGSIRTWDGTATASWPGFGRVFDAGYWLPWTTTGWTTPRGDGGSGR
jgi:hypothetical protein